jgi:hypothetical protein
MNINGLFQFMSSEQSNSFFCDVTPDNVSTKLEQLMQNPDFLTLTRVFVDDVLVLRQKVEVKLGQLCKKMKKAEDKPVPLPVNPTKLVDGQSAEGFQPPDQKENSEEDPINMPDPIETINESLGTHIGEGIYLQQEGHVFKMTTPQFVVYY